jgi:hypothetical protein
MKKETEEMLQKLEKIVGGKIIHVSHQKDLKTETMSADEFKKIKRIPEGLQQMFRDLKNAKIHHLTEFQFAPPRKFKFDIVLLKYKIAIEYEGLIYKANRHKGTGISGHTTVKGYTSNCDKYNLAAVNGWVVLRYTALSYTQMIDDVKQLIK